MITKLPAPGSLITQYGMAGGTNNGISAALQGLPAPGFSGVNLRSNYGTSLIRSRGSARGTVNTNNAHFWSFDISYHEMTQEEYAAIESFLMSHNTRLKPFYVTLPNYSRPNGSFMNFINSVASDIVVESNYFAGDSSIEVSNADFTADPSTLYDFYRLNPGCFINIEGSDALHKSIYKVSLVESSWYREDPVSSGKIRLHLFPPLQRDVTAGSTIKFVDPEFRVIQRNAIEPSFDEDGIVNGMTINVEEVQP